MPHQAETTVSCIYRQILCGVLAVSFVAGLSGCKSKPEAGPEAAPPGATYSGPRYLYNTIGSLTTLQNNRPQLVSGFGLVVGLDDTGSSEVPQALRQWLINEMTKQGVGSIDTQDILPMSPEELLLSRTTAVVRVVGFIPPGAVAGSRFDLLVSAADSSTTSLLGGRLYTTNLSAGGFNPERFYLTPLAEGSGDVYLDPRSADSPAASNLGLQPERREALVVAGGRCLNTRDFKLILNQPSRARAAAIGDRINELYPKAPSDRRPTANPISPSTIELRLPANYLDRPQEFVDLVAHTFLDRSPAFVPYQTEQLMEMLIDEPAETARILPALKALGPNARGVLRRYYPAHYPQPEPQARADADQPAPTGGPIPIHARLAALEAGAFVGDERASQFLLELAGHEDPTVRGRVARALVALPRSEYGERALRTLLDDPVRTVRLTAYETLAENNHPLIERMVIRDKYDQPKMVIDRVPVREPLIYLTQKDLPRLVIFNPMLAFEAPSLTRIWNDHLMIRRTESDGPAEMFYQYRDPKQPERLKLDRFELVPTVATLAYTLAHASTLESPERGYDLTYGQVVDAIYQLARRGALDTDVEIDRSALATLLDRTQGGDADRNPDRPETAPTPAEDPANPTAQLETTTVDQP